MNSEAGRRARHPIRVVARRTGLKADLIRAWERRYDAISPERSPGRHRFYTDADIERLLLLREATRDGRTIGQVAHLSDAELRDLVAEDEAAERPAAEASPTSEATSAETPPGDPPAEPPRPSTPASAERPAAGAATTPSPTELDTYLDSIRSLDARALRHQLERAAVERGYSSVLAAVVVPLVEEVDRAAGADRLRVVHERLARFEIRAFVEDLVRRAPVAPGAPRLLVTTPPGQRRETGALLVAATAAFEGWDVTYPGSDVPVDDIVLAARATQALAVALNLADADGDPRLGPELATLRRRLRELPLLVGGRAASAYAEWLQPSAELARAVRVDDLGELATVLGHLRAQAARGDGGRVPTRPTAVDPRAASRPRRPLGHRELPLHREAFERFELDPSVLTENGQLRLGDLPAVRRLVHRLDQAKAQRGHPERTLRAGRLNALGLLHEVACETLRLYKEQRNPGVSRRAVARLRQALGDDRLDRALDRFTASFPMSRDAWADTETTPASREERIERLLVVSLLNRNPAAASSRPLFDDSELTASSGIPRVIGELESFLRRETPVADGGPALIDRLLEAQQVAPDTLTGQLEHWLGLGLDWPPSLVDRLWTAIDVVREEEAPPFDGDAPSSPRPTLAFGQDPGAATGPVGRRRDEPAWQRNLVLVAKNTLVWLAQLSERFGRPIERLDQVPTAALDELVAQGFTGLWLIGIWKRSRASRRIKELAGRHDVVASAYAIDDYTVAEALGGDEALDALDALAHERGLRLACDMVFNHTGIDSRWVIEHPEYFLSVPERPFPSYTFTGDDLSSDPRVSLYLEDHYADQSDAAVVFQRIDRQTGEISFVYHGNDGSRLPWNDTAQLDVSRAEVRAALIETTIALAKRVSVLRLDAATTLLEEHFRRLWFPEPGQGGAVPSRALFRTRHEELDRRIPRELWREVVEAVEREAPDTLLVAEASGPLADAAVRELGVDRVYHGAFLHLLRERRNTTFRVGLENALAHDPAVLEGFTNFLTNPDEPTAAEQFGTGDRYVAACTLLAALPGLPLFGHGQAEGTRERYAMDAARPRTDETSAAAALDRHQREIAPLLAERGHFSDAHRLRLFEVLSVADDGERLDDVFALTNGPANDRRLVVVHHQEATVRGRIHTSARFRDADGLRRVTLADVLGLSDDTAHAEADDRYLVFRDRRTGRWFVRSSATVRAEGLELELGPWQTRVFHEFRELPDPDGRYRPLAERLHGVEALEPAELAVSESTR